MNRPSGHGGAREHRPAIGPPNRRPTSTSPGEHYALRAALVVLRARATVPEHGREAPATISARA
jgi:hypothetical protein